MNLISQNTLKLLLVSSNFNFSSMVDYGPFSMTLNASFSLLVYLLLLEHFAFRQFYLRKIESFIMFISVNIFSNFVFLFCNWNSIP